MIRGVYSKISKIIFVLQDEHLYNSFYTFTFSFVIITIEIIKDKDTDFKYFRKRCGGIRGLA